MSAGLADFPRGAIEACVERIAASPHFSRSLRLARFLRFIIEEQLEGRADELKERTIGVEVYERALEYDPRTDPIVRSEAHRLRARLAAYYAREGSADPIVIGIPKGSYVPDLRPSRVEPEHGMEGFRLIVAGFEGRGPNDRAAHPRAMGEALRAHLARRPGLRVLYRASEARGTQRTRAHPEADYRVEGRLEDDDGHCAVTVRLVRLADEREIWSETELFAGKRAAEVVATLAEPMAAAIATRLTRRAPPLRPAAARAYALYARGRHSVIQYSNTFDPRHLEPARRRLEAALEHDPGYVDALAELANLDLLRLYPPRGDVVELLGRSRSLLERALAADPRHARSLYLLGYVEQSALRPREALRLTESAVALDPDDPEGRTMLAMRYTSLGFWESAVAACDWALALDPVWEAAHWIKLYLLTRMGRLHAACLALEELGRVGTSPTELAIARFDLRFAMGDLTGAQAALASPESTFPLRPDLEDRRGLAWGLAEAVQGRRRDARRQLGDHRSDAPRFWDHAIRLALALGEEELALERLTRSPVNRSYRWLANEALARPYLRRPRWRAIADELHELWLQDLEHVGPRLPAPPPALPEPAALLRDDTRSSARGASTNPS